VRDDRSATPSVTSPPRSVAVCGCTTLVGHVAKEVRHGRTDPGSHPPPTTRRFTPTARWGHPKSTGGGLTYTPVSPLVVQSWRLGTAYGKHRARRMCMLHTHTHNTHTHTLVCTHTHASQRLVARRRGSATYSSRVLTPSRAAQHKAAAELYFPNFKYENSKHPTKLLICDEYMYCVTNPAC